MKQVTTFFTLRLKHIFLDRQLPHTVIELILSNDSTTVADAEGLAQAIMNNRIDEQEELVQAFTRMYNLVKDISYSGVDESALQEHAEITLFKKALEAYNLSQSAWEQEAYAKVVAVPATLIDSINEFFEAVMVMDKDEAIKNNRLQLLRLAYESMAIIGDISALK